MTGWNIPELGVAEEIFNKWFAESQENPGRNTRILDTEKEKP